MADVDSAPDWMRSSPFSGGGWVGVLFQAQPICSKCCRNEATSGKEAAMTLYAIYDPKPGQPELPAAIVEQFSWLAAVLPPVFLIRHGLWLESLGWVLTLVAIVLMSALMGGSAAVLLYLLAATWIGFAAPGLRRHALQWRGWTPRGERVALSADMAQLEAIR